MRLKAKQTTNKYGFRMSWDSIYVSPKTYHLVLACETYGYRNDVFETIDAAKNRAVEILEGMER